MTTSISEPRIRIPTAREPAGTAVSPPRIRDLTPIADSLADLASAASRKPLRKPEQRDMLKSLDQSIRWSLEGARDEAQANAVHAGRSDLDAFQAPLAQLTAAVALAREVKASGPWKRFSYPEETVEQIRTVETAVRAAEREAAERSGPTRNVYDLTGEPTAAFTAADRALLAEAPEVARAAAQRRFPMQTLLEHVAPPLFRLAKGPLLLAGEETIPKDRPVIFAITHQYGIWDVFGLVPWLLRGREPPTRVLMRQAEGPLAPMIGRTFDRAGAIPVKRGPLANASLVALVDAARSGQSVGAFPEGQVLAIDAASPHRDGLARIALNAQAEVYPIALHGGKLGSEGGHLRRLRGTVGAPITDHLGAALTAENEARLRDQIQSAMNAGRAAARKEREQG